MSKRLCRPLVGFAILAGLMIVLTGRAADLKPDAVEARMKKDIFFLASDECEGRGVDTTGINKAADYIAAEFQKAGLKPGGVDGTWFQPFTMTGAAKMEGPNTVQLKGPLGQEIELKIDQHFQPLGLSGSGKISAPVVFVGYGVVAKDEKYDDYQGVDVAGKIVVILRKTPRPGNAQVPFDGKNNATHAGLVVKVTKAEQHKAAAVLFVNDYDTAQKSDPLMPFRYTAIGAGTAKMPVVHVQRALVDQMLKSSIDKTLKEVEQDIDRDLKPQSAELKGWTATVQTSVVRPTLHVKNVIGVSEGAGPLAKETVVVGAHYDHLGYGGAFSLAKNSTGKIHYGADDNGSGTTSILELARRFGGKEKREGRRLVFMAFSGEESGLLGSIHYCKQPLFPLADTAAMVNLDMVGRLRPDPKTNKDNLIVYGTGTSKEFDKLIVNLNEKYGFQLKKVPGGMGPSDHASFYAKQIPVFFFFTGDHPDYHKPTDTADKINLVGMRRIADLVTDLIDNLSAVAERPNYIKVAGGGIHSGPTGPRLGIRPDYGDDKEGVLIGGVQDGGPAAKGGIKDGDRITSLGGTPVKNLTHYMELMAKYKKGDTVDVGILREKKEMKVPVKLE